MCFNHQRGPTGGSQTVTQEGRRWPPFVASCSYYWLSSALQPYLLRTLIHDSLSTSLCLPFNNSESGPCYFHRSRPLSISVHPFSICPFAFFSPPAARAAAFFYYYFLLMFRLCLAFFFSPTSPFLMTGWEQCLFFLVYTVATFAVFPFSTGLSNASTEGKILLAVLLLC